MVAVVYFVFSILLFDLSVYWKEGTIIIAGNLRVKMNFGEFLIFQWCVTFNLMDQWAWHVPLSINFEKKKFSLLTIPTETQNISVHVHNCMVVLILVSPFLNHQIPNDRLVEKKVSRRETPTQYFFELQIVEESQGNVILQVDKLYTIISLLVCL